VQFVTVMNTIPSAGLEWPLGVFYLAVPIAAVLMIANLVRDSIEAWQRIRRENR